MPRSSNTQHVITTLVIGDSQVIQHSSSCYNYPGHWWQPGLLVSVSHCLISCSSAVCCLTGLSIRSSAESRCEWERVVRGIVSSMSHSQMLTREHCPAPVLQSASVNHKHSHCLTTTVTWRRMTGYSTNISIYSLSYTYSSCLVSLPGHGLLLALALISGHHSQYSTITGHLYGHVISNHVLSANQVRTWQLIDIVYSLFGLFTQTQSQQIVYRYIWVTFTWSN